MSEQSTPGYSDRSFAGQSFPGDDRREWQLRQLIAHLPPRVGRSVHWLRRPGSRWARLPAGVGFCIGGVFWILPVLGLWMLPVGLVLLAEDIPPLRRSTGRTLDWLEGRLPHWFNHDKG